MLELVSFMKYFQRSQVLFQRNHKSDIIYSQGIPKSKYKMNVDLLLHVCIMIQLIYVQF